MISITLAKLGILLIGTYAEISRNFAAEVVNHKESAIVSDLVVRALGDFRNKATSLLIFSPACGVAERVT